jgi:hypothetical protein
MNRRHAAYCTAGCAMRFAILMGLHQNVPHAQLSDREHVEHRVRLWWSVYMLDRSWATMLGQPVSIRDEDIEVDLPSSEGLPASCTNDFYSVDGVIADLRIARLSAEVTSSIYGRNKQQDSFSHRVQQALQKLDGWVKSLPDSLRAKVEATNDTDMADTMLYLYYNQVSLCLLALNDRLTVIVLDIGYKACPAPRLPPAPILLDWKPTQRSVSAQRANAGSRRGVCAMCQEVLPRSYQRLD